MNGIRVNGDRKYIVAPDKLIIGARQITKHGSARAERRRDLDKFNHHRFVTKTFEKLDRMIPEYKRVLANVWVQPE